ncbi:hypothetical protein [Dyella sp. 2RAB6]|uniref:hypothetical protein n=1 Tax=Dyella sp. 2RAB6 TaxID=3232992 RepID=UPI003F93E6C3
MRVLTARPGLSCATGTAAVPVLLLLGRRPYAEQAHQQMEDRHPEQRQQRHHDRHQPPRQETVRRRSHVRHRQQGHEGQGDQATGAVRHRTEAAQPDGNEHASHENRCANPQHVAQQQAHAQRHQADQRQHHRGLQPSAQVAIELAARQRQAQHHGEHGWPKARRDGQCAQHGGERRQQRSQRFDQRAQQRGHRRHSIACSCEDREAHGRPGSSGAPS